MLNIADRTLDKKKAPKFNNKKEWFDQECRREKRLLNKAYRNFNKHGNNPAIKQQLFDAKRAYSILIKSKKRKNTKKLNSEIEEGETRNINWKHPAQRCIKLGFSWRARKIN